MAQQEGLFDGMIDCAAWIPHNYEELWYELAFPTFVPKFSKAKIYGNMANGLHQKRKLATKNTCANMILAKQYPP